AAGVDPDAIARGEGGDNLAKVMVDRARALAGRLPGQPPASGGGAKSSGKGASISIDKAWHGVHYLLCGQAEPGSDLASQAVMGGTEIGDDLGYGPARYFEADEVTALARQLTRPNLEAEMTARFDPAQMAKLGIYPSQFSAGDEKWLMDAFRQLRQFYVDASAANLAVVTCIE
ncbi:MAG TPA: YfbM family protein, partial [Candidatus Acidoferrum sp.]|nr:YfbM family protein [Candidatus Acidoferrum sp.]